MEAAVTEMEGRYREEMSGWIAGLAEWTLFVNPLTFDPLMLAGKGDVKESWRRAGTAMPAVSRWTAMRRFRHFLDKSSRVLGRPTEGVVALEPHQSGQPHGHGLLSIEGGLVGQEIATLSRLWRDYRGNGWIRLEVPRSQDDVARYSAKYMAKDVSELVMSASLGLVSTVATPGAGAGAEPGVGRVQPAGSS